MNIDDMLGNADEMLFSDICLSSEVCKEKNPLIDFDSRNILI